MTTVRVDDYSTSTGLRVRVYSGETGTTIQFTGDEWDDFVAKVKAGTFDGIAKEPWEPFIYTW